MRIRDKIGIGKEKLKKSLKKPVKEVRINNNYVPVQCSFIKQNGERCERLSNNGTDRCVFHIGRDSVINLKKKYSTRKSHVKLRTLIDKKINHKVKKGGRYKEVSYAGKYRPEYHPVQAIFLARQGLDIPEIATNFEVSLVTIRAWEDRYPEFRDAIEIAKTMVEAFYIMTGRENLSNPNFQTPLFKFLAMNASTKWSDKSESNVRGTLNCGVMLIPQEISEDEWEMLQKRKQEAIDVEYTEVVNENSTTRFKE